MVSFLNAAPAEPGSGRETLPSDPPVGPLTTLMSLFPKGRAFLYGSDPFLSHSVVALAKVSSVFSCPPPIAGGVEG